MTRWIEPATLAGERVVLEPLERRHEAGLARAAADGALWQLWLRIQPVDATDWLNRSAGVS